MPTTGECHHSPLPGTLGSPVRPAPSAAKHRGRSSTHPPCLPGRIVVCGAKLKRSIVPNSAAVYNFQRALQLEEEEVSLDRNPGAQTGA